MSEYDWTPSREYAHMVVDIDKGRMGFEYSSNRFIWLDFKEKKHAQSMRNAWKLITSDMRRSKMSIWFTVDGQDFELFYKVGYRLRKRVSEDGDNLLVGGRPASVHYVTFCIRNWCGLSIAKRGISMTEEEYKAWNRAQWGYYERR